MPTFSLLKHGAHYASTPADAGYIWGDYYLLESLIRCETAVPEMAGDIAALRRGNHVANPPAAGLLADVKTAYLYTL